MDNASQGDEGGYSGERFDFDSMINFSTNDGRPIFPPLSPLDVQVQRYPQGFIPKNKVEYSRRSGALSDL